MPEKNKFLEAALLYARKNWAVLPIKPRSKEPPLTANGSIDASTDPEQIRLWWKKTPDANVAIRTGDALFVVDVDETKGGRASYDALHAKHGFSPTMRQTTGGGEGHNFQLIYQNPPGQLAGGKNVCGWAGIDTRGYHNYILAPPSIHPDKPHRVYTWDSAMRNPLDELIAPMPGWLLKALTEEQSPNGDGARKPYEVPSKFQKGEQQKRLIQMAGRLRYAGAEYQEILQALTTFNQTRCTEPGPPEHIAQYARSMMKYAAGSREAMQAAEEVEQKAIVLPEPLTADQLLDLDIPLPEELIAGLLPRSGAALMVGSQRSGKTILAAQIALALMRNQEDQFQGLLGNYAVNLKAPGPVVVFEKDDPAGAASFKDIFENAQVPRGMPFRLYPKDRIPKGLVLGAAFCELIEKEVRETGAVMTVLDSYTTLRGRRSNGGDIAKDDSEEVGQLDELGKKLNCLILLIHHESTTTRSNLSLDWDARVAGSFAITAAAEAQIRVCRYSELPIDATERLVRFRSRHIREHQATLDYRVKTRQFAHLLDGNAAPLYPILKPITSLANAYTAFTAKDVEMSLAISRATAFRHLAALRAADAVQALGEGEYRMKMRLRD